MKEQFRVPLAKGKMNLTPEQKLANTDATRAGLMSFLEARRARLGQTAEDMMQSPEAAYNKQQEKIRAEQRKLVDDYMQTQASDVTM